MPLLTVWESRGNIKYRCLESASIPDPRFYDAVSTGRRMLKDSSNVFFLFLHINSFVTFPCQTLKLAWNGMLFICRHFDWCLLNIYFMGNLHCYCRRYSLHQCTHIICSTIRNHFVWNHWLENPICCLKMECNANHTSVDAQDVTRSF